MKKITSFLLIVFLLAIFVATPVFAATNAGIKPNSFLYFFDTTFEKVNLFFTFNPEKKAKIALEYADERLAEVETLTGDKDSSSIKSVMDNYTANVALATEKSKEVKDQQASENLFNTISDNASKNQEVLAGVLDKVPEEARDAILNAIEASKKEQEEAGKQIAELKGEVEKLKQEVAELKKSGTIEKSDNADKEVLNNQYKSSEIEKLKLENEKARFEAETAKAKAEAEKSRLEAKKFEAEKSAQNEANGKAKVELDVKHKADAEVKANSEAITAMARAEADRQANQTKIEAEIKARAQADQEMQQAEYLRQQNELLQQKIDKINALKKEYQDKLDDINNQILAIKQKYHADVETAKLEAINRGTETRFLEGTINRLTDDANWEIQKLQTQAEQLQVDYQNQINSIQ